MQNILVLETNRPLHCEKNTILRAFLKEHRDFYVKVIVAPRHHYIGRQEAKWFKEEFADDPTVLASIYEIHLKGTYSNAYDDGCDD